jgi:ERCC4-related helicase
MSVSDPEDEPLNLEDAQPVSPKEEIVEDHTGEDNLPSDEDGASPPSLNLQDGTPNIKPRAYQLEMLEESLKRNIIIAADTGSGKTHIAILRITHELERMPAHKFIWFLAPTVALCTQQFEVLQTQIPAVLMKLLKGEDGVDRWTSKEEWDAVLRNVKVVVSTFQILLDALSHGFVGMDSLALIVFDEGV